MTSPLLRRLSIATAMALSAASNAQALTLVPNLTIKAVVVGWVGEAMFVDVNEAVSATQTGFSCGTTNRFIMPVNSAMYKENLTAIMSAQATGAFIDFVVADCQSGAIRFVAVQIHNK